MANRLPRETRSKILHALVEGVGMRSIARIFDVHTKTVDRVLHEAGDFAIEYIDALNNLPVRAIQADELYAFVQTNQFEIAAIELSDLKEGVQAAGVEQNPGDAELRRRAEGQTNVSSDPTGRMWVYLAVCADTRFVLTYHIGSHFKEDTVAFIQKLARKLPRDAAGCLTAEITLTTDSLRAYHTVVEEEFGASINYGKVTKKFGKKSKNGEVIRVSPENQKRPGDRYIDEERKPIIGNPKQEDIHTCYIERQNANARMQCRRLTRKTYGFSKRRQNLERQVAIWIMYRNYCWIPDNKRKSIDHVTPAMALGIEDTPWDTQHLMRMSDTMVEEKRRLLKAGDFPEGVLEPEEPDPDASALIEIPSDDDLVRLPTYWVYHHKKLYAAKVHASECVNCRDGRGKKDGVSQAGEWYPFYDVDEARRFAQQLEPHNHSDCRMCVTKEYQKRDVRF